MSIISNHKRRLFKYMVTVERTYEVVLSDDISIDDVDSYLGEEYESVGDLISEEVTSIECTDQWYE